MAIPASQATVTVRIIDSTSTIDAPFDFVDPPIKGTERLHCPAFVFLVEHSSGRKLLFDLGVRKDFEKLPPPIQAYIQQGAVQVTVEKDVLTILNENGVNAKEIEAIIWSHWHWDHTGDPSTFPSSTAVIVGAGVKDVFLPGFPENPQSPLLQTDYEGRELREITFQGPDALKIGDFDALDYFGDGSFYILDAPGHTIGHLCALARATSDPPSFILMGADACHHSGEMRPSKQIPLPETIAPHPLQLKASHACPGAVFESVLRNGDKTAPFYGQKRPGGGFFNDPDAADRTIEKIQEFDGAGNVFVVIAHDSHLKDVVDFFPASANDFAAKGWHELARWRFLGDFKEALPQDAVARATEAMT
jgi:glyoxylase-like metal-dependent hydrolase (beta-lactamase superfamily II)